MQIHWTHPDELSAEDRAAVEERLLSLEEGHRDLIDVRVSVRSSRHHRHGGHEAKIVCRARGRELVAARTAPDVALALNEALDVFERELRRLRERREARRNERPAEPPHMGLVDRVFPDEGYGFILTDAGEQVYFHRNAVTDGLSFEHLEEGQRVGLNLEAGEKGMQATSVTPVPPDTPSP